MTSALAVLGGPQSLWPVNFKSLFTKNRDFLIGVDRGSLRILEAGFRPRLSLGDFDSLTKKELGQVEAACPELRYANPVKDDTDSEMMLKAALLDYGIDELTIIGAGGGRLDHSLVNLLAVCEPRFLPYAEKITFVDRQNELHFLLPGKHVFRKKAGFDYFGVGNLLPVKGLSIKKARYPLKATDYDYPRMWSSNEFVRQDVTVSLEKGLGVFIYSRD